MLPTPPASPKPSGVCGPEDRLGLILADRIQLTGILGLGAYGTVYRARDVETGVQYAVKALNKLGLDARQKRFQDREIQLHYRVSQHPNVVSMQKILDTVDCTFVVLEYCPEGDLFAKITEEGDYVGKDHKARTVFLQILDAVRHCHANGVYHRDLKPENILVRDDGWTVKLADFGLATQERATADFGCGSTFYMSPECQQATPKPFACYASAPNDVWSLGVILVNLTCGRNPWKRASMEDSTFRAFARDRNFLRTILPISDGLNCILQRIFELDPKRRISLDALREYVLFCPSLGQDSDEASLPPTPPYSPEEKPLDEEEEDVDTPFTLEAIPHLDPLPVQRFPPGFQSQPQPQPQPQCTNSRTRRAPVGPYPSRHTYAAKSAGSPAGFASSASAAAIATNPPALVTHHHNNGFVAPSASQNWPARCSNLVPAVLANQACWRNVPVF